LEFVGETIIPVAYAPAFEVTETKVTKEGENERATVRIAEISPKEIRANLALTEAQAGVEVAKRRDIEKRLARLEADRLNAQRLEAEQKSSRQRAEQERQDKVEADRQKAAAEAEQRLAAQRREEQERMAKIEEERQKAIAEVAAREEAKRKQEAAEQAAKAEAEKQAAARLARARIDTLQTQQQGAEQTCKREEEKLALLQSAGAKDQLRVFENELTCERLRPIIQAALSPPAARVAAVPEDTPELIRNAQSQLRRIGCFDGENDGVLNGETVRALKDYLARRGQLTDEPKITPAVLSKIKAETSRVCPLACPPGNSVEGERCIAKRHHEEVPERPTARHEKRQHEWEAKRATPVPRASERRPRAAAQAASRPSKTKGIGVGF
jgi:hypothetical protein